MDEKKIIRRNKIKKTAVVLLPIILAVTATLSVALMMSGNDAPLPEPPATDDGEITTADIPANVDPEKEEKSYSEGLSVRIGADGKATVIGLGSCADRIVYIPEKTADGVPITAIGDSAFAYAAALDEVVMPSSVITIGAYAFRGSSILRVSIGSSVVSIGNGAFADCQRLAEIRVDGANPLYASRDGVLFNREMTAILCYPSGRSDSSYTIPKSVTKIGNYAFTYCDALKKLKYAGSDKEWARVSIGSGNTLLDKLTVETDRSDK